MAIPLLDIKRQHAPIAGALRRAALKVLDSGAYILGPEGEKFETEFAASLGMAHAVGVSSGTEAIVLALEALGVKKGDEVIVPALSFIATATAVSQIGADPVFVDIHPRTWTLDPEKIQSAITRRTKAVIPVHLYGYPADMGAVGAVARRHGLKIVEDCAQAHGTLYRGKPAGSFGDIAAFSFYPTKTLGAMGDAGAMATPSAKLARILKELRNAGRRQGENYGHARVGHNSRLDDIQAAILRVKLRSLPSWVRRRRAIAALYQKGLAGLPLETPPEEARGCVNSYCLYVVKTENRDKLARHMKRLGIGTGVYYPRPIPLQEAYRYLRHKPGDFPVSERAGAANLALPMFPGLARLEVERVCQVVRRFFN